ncbi:MAG TPA: ATP-dependent Clp protease adaptor ClpS, partial [Spirochaetota bacterium]|nr:ATP-dependent Clp protease adaptor ClpS [Spirochaetota bacterium]
MPTNTNSDHDLDGDLALDSRDEVEHPKMYRVIMHNDHYTTMDFVVEVIIAVFHKPAAEATRMMLEIHKQGMSVCGVYTYDIAATKTGQVHQMARERG